MAGLLFSFLSFLLAPTPCPNSLDIVHWCSRTPHRESCQYYFSKYDDVCIRHAKEFKTLAIGIALEKAFHLQDFVVDNGNKIRKEHEKVAWMRCLVLFDSTIHELNRASVPDMNDIDQQTCLNSAIKNMGRCQKGFVDTGALSNEMIQMSKNISELIGNALAINHGLAGGFPSRFSASVRKMSGENSPSIVVALDGSGDFKTINEAVKAAKSGSDGSKFVIHVKEGVYQEKVMIPEDLTDIMIVGEGIGKTIITGDTRAGNAISTFDTATVAVVGDGFVARGITFRNTAGRSAGQAVALKSQSDRSAFYQCSFEGYQDTLYVHSHRQFYKECDIYGSVDFIFGDATAVFQDCNVYLRMPGGNEVTITAQKRSDPDDQTGIVVQNSKVLPSPELKPSGSVHVYLGRPWGEHAQTAYVNNYLAWVDPEGWLAWDENTNKEAVNYIECRNTGPGSSTDRRVQWGGVHAMQCPSDVLSRFTVGSFLDGDSWLPSTGVPYSPGIGGLE